jgi:hypothetical protein
MPVVRTLIQSAFLSSAKPEWDRWFGPRDERAVAEAGGGTPWPSGVDARLSVRAVYAIVVALVAASCVVGTFSAARDVSWRMGVPRNLWEPALWYCTSGVVVVALLSLARRGAMLARGVAARPLRDGRMRILIDPHEIVSVSSAGNYVEYALTGGRRHLIRATLRAEEARLSSFGVARVHRTRLVNVKRMVAVRWRPSGDFEVRVDTGEVVVGSRRFKGTVAGIV